MVAAAVPNADGADDGANGEGGMAEVKALGVVAGTPGVGGPNSEAPVGPVVVEPKGGRNMLQGCEGLQVNI